MGQVVSRNEIKSIVENLKNNGKQVVFTNGCFDILHIGHVRYLKKCAKCGDILVIGLNSDNSVKRLKGETRPINNESDRAELLSELGFVDYVVVFEEDTPINLLKEIEPSIYCTAARHSVQCWGLGGL